MPNPNFQPQTPTRRVSTGTVSNPRSGGGGKPQYRAQPAPRKVSTPKTIGYGS